MEICVTASDGTVFDTVTAVQDCELYEIKLLEKDYLMLDQNRTPVANPCQAFYVYIRSDEGANDFIKACKIAGTEYAGISGTGTYYWAIGSTSCYKSYDKEIQDMEKQTFRLIDDRNLILESFTNVFK